MKQKSNLDCTEEIKANYRSGKINFVQVLIALHRQAAHTPAAAQQIAYELIKEKHGDG